jgi:hypothetical protein
MYIALNRSAVTRAATPDKQVAAVIWWQFHDTPALRMHPRHPVFESLSERILIIGNSGAGKSTLAGALASLVRVPVIDLDLLHWAEDGYGQKRNEDAARQLTLEVFNQPRWIIECVFGWLAEVALPEATALIWLDCPWSLCRAGLLVRGQRRRAAGQAAADLMK